MQAAYQEYMLGKSKVGVHKSPAKTSYGADNNRSGSKKKAHQKGYRPILRAVQGRLEEWKDTNQKLEGVLRSIANLRDRIYWESTCLCMQHQKDSKQQQPSWRDSGFRSSFSNHNSYNALLNEDVHLALNHDLLQHERMLSGVRTLVASLAQTIDEIGRRLDEWMLQNLIDRNDQVLEDDMVAIQVKEQYAFELAQEVYSLLASDLYRKQKVATTVLDSYHDGVLGGRNENSSEKSFLMSNPRDVIKKSSKELSSPERKNLILDIVDKLLIIS